MTRADLLAELIAEGVGLCAAAAAMGISRHAAARLWKRICADLGEQAA